MNDGATAWAGVDVGGSKILAAAIDSTGAIVGTAHGLTPDPGEGVHALDAAVDGVLAELFRQYTPLGLGVAAAGFVDSEGEQVAFAPHLAWRDAPVRRQFADRWQVPVVLDNDANAGAWAEHCSGAGRGTASSLTVNLGTGIGGGLVLDNRLHRGSQGMASEFGHMQVVPDGRQCPCGGRGCWEQYCSGPALARAAQDAGGERLVGATLLSAAEAGNAAALAAFAEVGRWLGVGLANLTAAFDPELIIIGGGPSVAREWLLEPARGVLASTVVGRGHRRLPELRVAEHGPAAGALGAALLSQQAAS